MILLVNFNQEEEIKCSQKEREKTFNYTFKYKGVETKFYQNKKNMEGTGQNIQPLLFKENFGQHG